VNGTLVHCLEAAWNPGDVLDAGRDRLRLDPEDACGLHRSEDVLDVEAAAESRLERNAVDDEAGAAGGQLQVLGVRQLEGHRLLADVTELLGEPPAMRVPDVDDRRRPASIQVRLGEEPALGVVYSSSVRGSRWSGSGS
jgi:hypothetical protein